LMRTMPLLLFFLLFAIVCLKWKYEEIGTNYEEIGTNLLIMRKLE
jgi:hypothetical protein